MTLPVLKYKTIEEYLAFEDEADGKHEYYQGEIFNMAGGTIDHNRVVRNTLTAIDQFLKDKTCQVYPSDLKVYIEANSLYTYPDISIICDAPEFYAERKDTILNPAVIIEVLSPGTKDYDRGGKFVLYRQIPSLQEYVLISSMGYSCERFKRQANNQWILTEVKLPTEKIAVETIGFETMLTELYRNVNFTEGENQDNLHPVKQ